MHLTTPRLILRRWQMADIEPFAAMNSDPEVMRFFPTLLSREQTTSMVERIESHFELNGFGLWALELNETGEFIGFTGLSRPTFDAHFTPCVEIGWRIAHRHWGRGFAPEAASEAIRDGFDRLSLPEIVSFTAAINKNSISVMKKLMMKTDSSEDFLHPLVQAGSPLQLHVLYRLAKEDWSTVNQ